MFMVEWGLGNEHRMDGNEKVDGEPVGDKTVVGLVGKRGTVVGITSKLKV